MPLSSNPDDVIWFSLSSDEAKDEASRPAFRCRYLTVRQTRKVRQLISEAAKESDDEKAGASLLDAICVGVNGWRNVNDPESGAPLEFARENVATVLTAWEMFEVAGKQVAATSAQEFDLRKKSLSQQGGSSASVASTTAPGDAQTSPPKQNP